MANLPTYVAKGAVATGTTSVAPGVPAGIMNEDFLVMIVHTPNQAVTTPAGWTEAPGSPVSTGTAAAIGGVRLTVYYKSVGGVESAPTVAVTSGNATVAMIFAFRGVNLLNPFNVTPTTRVDSAATTAMSWQTLTTTAANTLILMLTANDHDLAGTAGVGAVTAAGLTGITELHDQTIATGVGGGIHAAYGNRAAAGAIGTMTATGAASNTHAYMTMALQAAEPVVRTVGQYEDDFLTVVPVTGSTTKGDNDNLYLMSEYDSGIRTASTTPKVEVDPIATAFNGTATTTHRALTQTDNVNPARALRGSTMIYDDVNKRLILFGGFDGGTTRYNEVWGRYIDKPGQPWRKITPSGTAPTGRNLHSFTFVKGNLTSGGAVRAYGIVWGGATPTDMNDMYTLRLDTPGSEAWATVTQTSAPTARSYVNGHTTVTPGTDSSNQYFWLFGGWAAVRENAIYRCLFDVDTPTAVTWTVVKAQGAAGSPSGRTGMVIGYKASTNKIYQYGGFDGTTYYTEFWEYDVATNAWTNTSPTGTAPTASEAGSGGYDVANNRFWYTGGWTTNGTFQTGTNHIVYINDVGGSESYVNVRPNTVHPGDQTYPGHSFAGFCVVNESDRNWLCLKNMITRDPTADHERYGYIIDFNEGVTSDFPVYGEVEGEYYSARDAMASVWNPQAQEWLVIGGFDDMYDDGAAGPTISVPFGTHAGDVWTYNEADNSLRYSVAGFKGLPPLEGRVAVYDSVRDRIIVFGGLTGVAMTSFETWSLTRDGNGNYKAAKLYPTGTKPGPRWLGAAAFDDTNNRMIIALGGNSAGPINDVWELSFASSADGVWTQRTPTGSVTGLAGVGFADVKATKRLYIFGGASNSALSTVSSQFVYLDYSTTNCAWTTLSTTGGTARRTPSVDVDNTWNRLLVFGGFNGTASINTMSWVDLTTPTAWVNVTPSDNITPDARRSSIGQVINGKFYITAGRSDSSRWYRNTWELQPDYTTPANSRWANKFPGCFTPIYNTFTGGSLGTGYHWQAWTTEVAVDSTKVSFPTAIDYYTFDASDAAISDPNNVWTDDAFGADGKSITYALTTTLGSTSSNFLHIQGTTAPSGGGPISQVRARVTGPAFDYDITAAIYTDGLAQLLGSPTLAAGSSSWATLSTPTGGWTWAKLQALETKVYATTAFAPARFYKVEIEVTTGNAENVADFNLGSVTPSYEKVHSTDALKKGRFVDTHTTDAVLRDYRHYTKESGATLPTTNTPRAEAFYPTDYTNVSSDNGVYVDETGDVSLLFYFERYHTNSVDQISATWNGKSTIAPSTRTVYLQIWNKTTVSWETIASDNTTAANTDFNLIGGKTTGLSNYYDTGNKVVFRVYQ